jgi:Flp pilus assembly protein TadD
VPSKSSKQWLFETAGIAALLLLVAVIYARTSAYPFLNYDDGRIVFNHPVMRQGLSWKGLSWALTHGLFGIWMPATALTHMTDVTLFGLRAGGHHLTSVLWHALAVLLFYAALRALTGARGASFLAAALFAAHPLRVEDVAWVASRKDLVCGAFFALALLAHARYARRPGALRYAALLAAVLLAFAGKTSALPLPAVLLLLDAWPLGRFHTGDGAKPSFRRAVWLVMEKAPMGLLALAVLAVTWGAQHEVGSIVEEGAAPPALRMAAVGGNYAHYLGAFFWPFGLSPHYPIVPTVPWKAGAAWALLVALSLGALAVRRKRPWLTVGWFWFLLALIPVIGIISYGNAPYADRHMYLSGMGLSMAVAWLLCEAGERLARCRGGKTAGFVMAAALVLALAGLSWRQAGFWRDEPSVFARVLRLYPDDDLAHAKLGDCRYAQGDLEGATKHYLEAIRLQPNITDWNYNLGSMLIETNPGGALPWLEKAVRLAPERGDIQTNLGYALLQLKQPAAALPYLEAGAKLDPENPNAHINLGVAFMNLGRKEEARAAFERSLTLDSANAAAQANLKLLGS